MRNDGATPTIVERDETVLEAVEETVSNLCNLKIKLEKSIGI